MDELVERARKGDHDAFAALVGLTIDRMNATAWLIARDRTIIAELEPIRGQSDARVLTMAFRDAQYIVLGNGFRSSGEPSAWHGP